jgi:hypothetical protein
VKSQRAKAASLLLLVPASSLLYVPARSSDTTGRVTSRPIISRPIRNSPGPQLPTARCHNGTLTIFEQPEPQLLKACIDLGSQLIVDLHPSTSQGPRWSGPPAEEASTILARTFSGTVHGMLSSHFTARKVGTTQVVAESNAACTFDTAVPPCSLPEFITTLVVRVSGRPVAG